MVLALDANRMMKIGKRAGLEITTERAGDHQTIWFDDPLTHETVLSVSISEDAFLPLPSRGFQIAQPTKRIVRTNHSVSLGVYLLPFGRFCPSLAWRLIAVESGTSLSSFSFPNVQTLLVADAAEDWDPQSAAIRETYLRQAKSCALYVGLFGCVFSAPTIEEYRAAAGNPLRQVLVYVKECAGGRDAALTGFLHELSDPESGRTS
jgi:hypothetical protein